MAQVSFRNRILLALILLGVVPTSIGLVGVVLSLQRNNPPEIVDAALSPVATTGRQMLQAIDTLGLSPEERRAFRAHVDSLNNALARAGTAVAFSRRLTPTRTAVILVLSGLFLYFTWVLSVSLSRQLSRPIDELIGWTALIRRQSPLPEGTADSGAPEFAALRAALREMAAELQQARVAELEAERLRAFREVARRVAHEMKNPLTPVRFALAELSRTASPAQREAIEVLTVESGRLDLLAKDFSNLGRLPEGPTSEVDIIELLVELTRTSLPPEILSTVTTGPDTPHIIGHYDPLRRAFGNLLRNAVEASGGSGSIDVHVEGERRHGVTVEIADHGVGIPPEKKPRIFAPYYTDKPDGTGLGLAIVKQSIDLHRGTIEVRETPGGGATFIVQFPPDLVAGESIPPPYASPGIGRPSWPPAPAGSRPAKPGAPGGTDAGET